MQALKYTHYLFCHELGELIDTLTQAHPLKTWDEELDKARDQLDDGDVLFHLPEHTRVQHLCTIHVHVPV